MRSPLIWLAVGTLTLGTTPLTVTGASAAPALSMTATDLGTLGGTSSDAVAVNNRGQVVGSSGKADGSYAAFLWERGVMREIPIPGSNGHLALDINDSGAVIGVYYKGDVPGGFLWTGSRLIDLGAMTGPMQINERGEIVGVGVDAAGNQRAYLWRKGRLIDLGTPGGGSASYANKINNRGQAAGNGTTPESTGVAALWTSGKARLLGPGRSMDLNDAGDVIVHGPMEPNKEMGTATLWSRGSLTPLGDLDGNSGAEPQDVNNRREVIGTSPGGDGNYHAFLWRNGTMLELPVPQRGPAYGIAINDRGQVLISQDEFSYVWDRGRMAVAPALRKGGHSYGRALSERGVVVGGSSIVQYGPYHAVLWKIKG